jgi:Gnt-I system high-affinity gluconate transporter
VYLAVGLCSALSVTHGFLPPHPSPTAIIPLMQANLGQTLILGLIASVPVIILAGPVFARTVLKIEGSPLASLKVKIFEPHEMPSSGISFLCALLPVVLLAVGTWITSAFDKTTFAYQASSLISDANIVMLLSLLIAYYFLGIRRGTTLKTAMQEGIESSKDVFPILMIVAGAGILKEILISSGISNQIGEMVKNSAFSPLITGWFIAAVIRLSLGSATVAGLTAAGLIAPGIDPALVNPNLMVLSIGAGSLMFSHVNDTGFWMFKEYFNLNIKDTIKSWSLMETVVSIAGLGMVLILDIFV